MMWSLGLLFLLGTLFFPHPALASSGPKAIPAKPLATRLIRVESVSCSKNQCTGLDPYQSGCARSFYVAATSNVGNIRVELEYSPLCGTNWTQGYWLDGVARHLEVTIERLAGQDGPEWFDTFYGTSPWINSNQAYAFHNQAVGCMYIALNKPTVGLCTLPT